MPLLFYPGNNNLEKDVSVMHRTRLYELINENEHCQLIGVIADSGFGKSALIQGYLAHENKSVLWCAFNANDAVDTLLDEILGNLQNGASYDAIVFDNCSIVANETEFVNAIPEITAFAPDTTIFLIGSALPELPFAVMRAKKRYFELNHDDLTLSRQETEQYFNDFLGLSLGTHQIDLIYDKTHGWFISLQLINTYLRKNRIDNLNSLDLNFLSDITDINDYFSYNLYENQSAEMQKFLLEICPVTELEADVINELLDIDNAEVYLDELKEYHGFAYITPSTRHLRLHPLLRQYLYERYMKKSEAKCLAAHNKLISIYEKKRNYIMAFSHAVACNNYNAATALMTKISDRYNPIQLLGFIDGHLEEISPTLLFSTTTLFLQRCIPEHLMVELLQPLTDAINHEYDSLRMANLQHRLGVIYWHLGNVNMARNLLEKSLTNAEMLHNTEIMAFNYQLLADCHLVTGDTDQALRCARNALYLSEHNRIPLLQLHTLEVFSRIQLTLDHIDQADDYIWQALELATPESYELFWLNAALSQVEIKQGEFEEAINHASKAIEIVAGSICGYDVSYTHYIRAKALTAAGRLDEARADLQVAYENSTLTTLLRLEIIEAMAAIEEDTAVRDALITEHSELVDKHGYENFVGSLCDSEISEAKAPQTASPQGIVINTFENFSVSYNSIPITINRTASLRLLQLLIVNRGRMITRDYIIEQLFPDSSASAGSNKFNVALSVLRKSMDAASGLSASGDSCIIREKDRYQLNLDLVTIDATDFEDRYMKLKKKSSEDINAWLELSALYSGTFIPESPYENYLASERERLTGYQKDVVLSIARIFVQKGDLNKALTYFNRVIELDMYDEDIYYEIIEHLLDNDYLVKAQAIADRMKLHLEDELGIQCSDHLNSMFEYYNKRKNR